MSNGQSGNDMRMYFGKLHAAEFRNEYTIVEISVDDRTPIRFGDCLIMEIPKGMTKRQVLQALADAEKRYEAENQS